MRFYRCSIDLGSSPHWVVDGFQRLSHVKSPAKLWIIVITITQLPQLFHRLWILNYGATTGKEAGVTAILSRGHVNDVKSALERPQECEEHIIRDFLIVLKRTFEVYCTLCLSSFFSRRLFLYSIFITLSSPHFPHSLCFMYVMLPDHSLSCCTPSAKLLHSLRRKICPL